MELVQEAIVGLRAEMNSFQEEGVALEKQRQVLLSSMEEMLESTNSDTEVLEDKNAGTVKVLQQLKSGLNEYNNLHCCT